LLFFGDVFFPQKDPPPPPQPWPCYQNSNMIFRQKSYTVKFKVTMEWQHQKEASVHRPVKGFADDRKRICQYDSTLKGQTRRVLGKCRRLCCGQPLTVDLDHQVSGRQEKRRQISVKPASVPVFFNIPMSTSRRGPGRRGVFMR